MKAVVRNKSYRFYKSDHLWIKKHAKAQETTFLGVLGAVFEVQDKYHHYFEQASGMFQDRPEKPVELTSMLKVAAKVYSVSDELVPWLENFFNDELVLMGNDMTRVLLIHLLLNQYKAFINNQAVVLEWYRHNMPHLEV